MGREREVSVHSDRTCHRDLLAPLVPQQHSPSAVEDAGIDGVHAKGEFRNTIVDEKRRCIGRQVGHALDARGL